MTLSGGEQRLNQAIKRLKPNRPSWSRQRIDEINRLLVQHRQNLRTLRLQEARYGIDVPLNITNQLAETLEIIEDLTQEQLTLLAGWDHLCAVAQHKQLSQQ